MPEVSDATKWSIFLKDWIRRRDFRGLISEGSSKGIALSYGTPRKSEVWPHAGFDFPGAGMGVLDRGIFGPDRPSLSRPEGRGGQSQVIHLGNYPDVGRVVFGRALSQLSSSNC